MDPADVVAIAESLGGREILRRTVVIVAAGVASLADVLAVSQVSPLDDDVDSTVWLVRDIPVGDKDLQRPLLSGV